MLRSFTNRLLVPLIVLTLLSCNQEDPHYDNYKRMGGEWIWESSIGGDNGETLTPENTMSTSKLVINFNTFRTYVNDMLVLESTYNIIQTDVAILGSEEGLLIELESGMTYGVVREGDQLELVEQCLHCYWHIYNRK